MESISLFETLFGMLLDLFRAGDDVSLRDPDG